MKRFFQSAPMRAAAVFSSFSRAAASADRIRPKHPKLTGLFDAVVSGLLVGCLLSIPAFVAKAFS